MNIEKTLLPNIDNITNNQIKKNLKTLFLLRDPDAEKILERVNLIRRSEGLNNLTKNEIIINKSQEKNNIERELKIIHQWECDGTIGNFLEKNIEIKELNNDILFNNFIDLSNQVDSIKKVAIGEYENNQFLAVVVYKDNNYELKILGASEIDIYVENKGSNLEAKFTELDKKIVTSSNDLGWKVKKL